MTASMEVRVAITEKMQSASAEKRMVPAGRRSNAKLDRVLWKGCEHCNAEWRPKDFSPGEYFAHDFRIDGDSILFNDSKFGWEGVLIKFCPFCGRPLNEEAWAEVERRMNGGTTDIF